MSSETSSSKKPRRFLPEPVEISSRSSTDRPLGHTSRSPNHHPAGRLTAHHHIPPVEEHHALLSMPGTNKSEHTAHSPGQKHHHERNNATREQNARALQSPKTAEQTWKGRSCAPSDTLTEGEESQICRRRKFTPLLVETARRSVRGGSSPHGTPECVLRARSESLRGPNRVDNVTHQHGSSMTPESSFSYQSLQRRYQTRRHSFRVPDLPAIPSSCSEASDESERESSPPPSKRPIEIPTSDRARRESCDEEISSYLLSLAAQAAEQQLKEQALAAFPNEQVYQPVDHFAIDNEDEECPNVEGLPFPGQLRGLDTRRNSAADLSSELACLQFYKQKAGMKPPFAVETDGSLLPRPGSLTDLGRAVSIETPDKPSQNGRRASPPMLGNDLIFPRSSSPETTMYESGNLFHMTRNFNTNPGLWHASPHLDGNKGEGLWMGTCKKHRRVEAMQIPDNNSHESNPTPAARGSTMITEPRGTTSLLAKPQLDMRNRIMDEDSGSYPSDEFVTQIYNYLSLGYPCVARYYDHELSKISGISVVELRENDISTDAKGFVFPEEQRIARNSTSSSCKRWHALRLYIHKQSNQRPCVPEEDGYHEKWGVRERRGSWAV